jgi:maltose alpha-D-glucosyltransferase/alpha-amylase
MQWDDSLNAGFSSAPGNLLYTPIDPAPDRPTVSAQNNDPLSLLNCVRRFISLRKCHPALCATGDFKVVFAEAGRYPFVYSRSQDGETLLIALNPSNLPVEVRLPLSVTRNTPTTLYGCETAFSTVSDGWVLQLPGVSGGIYQLD